MDWRIVNPSRDNFDDPVELEAFDWLNDSYLKLIGARGGQSNFFSQLAVSPVIAQSLAKIGRTIRDGCDRGVGFSHADREWIDQVVCHDLDTEILQGTHLPAGLNYGIRAEAIQALRAGREEDLTEDERLMTDFIRAVMRGTMNDDIWARFCARSTERGAVEFAVLTMFLQLIARMLLVLRLTPPKSREEIDQLIDDYKSGRQPIPQIYS